MTYGQATNSIRVLDLPIRFMPKSNAEACRKPMCNSFYRVFVSWDAIASKLVHVTAV